MRQPTAVLAAVLGLTFGPAADAREPPDAKPAPVSILARFRMRAHGSDLRRIERDLLSGHLDDATSRALGLIYKVDEPDVIPWRDAIRKVAEAALDLVYAPGVDEGLRREARVVAACAACHTASKRPVALPAPPPIPPDRATAEARMARHVWATDRMWEGLIAPAEDRWRLGLQVLAENPLPFSPLTEAPLLGDRLRELARRQLAPGASREAAARAGAYGEMLVTCAACHQVVVPRGKP